MDFTFRLYKDTTISVILSSISHITISNITIVSKPAKFDGVCFHNGNQKKFGYSISLSKPFNKVSGSHSSPSLTFKGEYIDIIIKNFPRYPVFTQEYYAAKSAIQGYGYYNFSNKGYPIWTEHRKFEFIIN